MTEPSQSAFHHYITYKAYTYIGYTLVAFDTSFLILPLVSSYIHHGILIDNTYYIEN